MVGSACFVIGSVPAYLDAVGGLVRRRHLLRRVDLLHLGVVLPARAGAEPGDDRRRRGHPARAGAACGCWAWLPARPQLAGRRHPVPRHAVLQHQHLRGPDPQRHRRRVRPLRLAPRPVRVGAVPRRQHLRHPRRLGRFLRSDPASLPWRIAWINMLGSVLFMASALASYVLPSDRRGGRHPDLRRRHPARRRRASSSAPP